eukprot:GCRY01000458.1.p1 GENE.GCRY01000458.1~~GCRY01000458.1.p1  ORF type:complete len:345 (+),score=52.38 GCRY01000458.1:127-1035(+)
MVNYAEETNPANWSVKELKHFMELNGINTAGLAEKQDLINAVSVHLANLAEQNAAAEPTPTQTSAAGIRDERRRIANLDCRVLQNGEGKPEVCFVVLHGLGSSADNMVPFAEHFLQSKCGPMPSARFVMVDAPLFEMGGRAWFPINPQEILMNVMTGRLFDMKMGGVDEAASSISKLIEAIMQEAGLPSTKIILGGFSQGAITSTCAALHFPSLLGGLVIMSGCLMDSPTWAPLAAQKKDLPIIQSHGKDDFVLPFLVGESLRNLFKSHGDNYTFIEFQGGHELCPQALPEIYKLIQKVSRA